MSDFETYMQRKDVTAKHLAERDASSARYDLAKMQERCAEVLSQHEPLNSLGLDRELTRKLVRYIQCGRLEA